jgi:hypothetical protein
MTLAAPAAGGLSTLGVKAIDQEFQGSPALRRHPHTYYFFLAPLPRACDKSLAATDLVLALDRPSRRTPLAFFATSGLVCFLFGMVRISFVLLDVVIALPDTPRLVLE